MALTVLDAGVVIALLDPDDVHHAVSIDALTDHADDRLLLPASAYAELLVAPMRAGRLDEVRGRLHELAIDVLPVDAEVAEHAAALRAEHPPLRLPDALVLASAGVVGADGVLTIDRRWARFPDVRVVG